MLINTDDSEHRGNGIVAAVMCDVVFRCSGGGGGECGILVMMLMQMVMAE